MKTADTIKSTNRSMSLLIGVGISIPFSLLAHGITGAPLTSLLLVDSLTFYLLLRNLDILKTPRLRSVYVLINLLKLGLLLINAHTKSIPFTGVDWSNYDRMARIAVEQGGSVIDLYNHSFDFFVFFASLIYQTFGANVNQLFFYMLPLSLILFRYTYKTVMLITQNEKRSAIAALLVIAWPANIVFSVSVLREIAIQTLVAISFYHFVRYIKLRKGFFASSIFAIGATLMHSGIIAILTAYFYLGIQRKLRKKDYKILHVPSIIAVAAVLLLVTLTPLWGALGKQFSDIHSVSDITSVLEVKNDALGNATTNYISSVPQSTGDMLSSLPYRFVMFVISPMPWQVHDTDTLIAFVVSTIPQALLVIAILLVFHNRKNLSRDDKNIVTAAMLCIVLMFTVYSFGTNNYGTAMRHRTKVLPIAIVVVGAYASMSRHGRLFIDPALLEDKTLRSRSPKR